MTERATLQALLNRVLEGTGPDRELDAEIWHIAEPAAFTAPHGLDCKPWRYIGNGVWRDDSDPEGHNKAFAPPYTTSLDAALTLVPEGWGWGAAMRHWLTPVGAAGSVWQAGQPRATFTADAATPARALMAACLKAKMEAQPLSNP